MKILYNKNASQSFTIVLLVLSLMFLSQSQLSASEKYYLGPGLSAAGVYDAVSFQNLPGIPGCCPDYTYGLAFGAGLSFGAILPLSGQLTWGADLSAIYSSHSLTSPEDITLSVNNLPYDGEFTHYLDVDLFDIELFPNLGYFLSDNIHLCAGPFLNIPLTLKYHQWEEITDPESSGHFPDSGLPTRNDKSGTASDIRQIDFGLKAVCRAFFPVNTKKSIWLSPGIYFSAAFLGPVRDTDWMPLSAGINISLYFSGGVSQAAPPPLPEPEAPEPETITESNGPDKARLFSELQPEFSVLDSNDIKQKVCIEEFLSIKLAPILRYIFFAHKDSTLPQRYSLYNLPMDTIGYNEKQYFSSPTIDIYHDLLNIIGSRLHRYLDAVLNIKGCYDGGKFEKETEGLTAGRANAAYKYLNEIWGLDTTRINVIAGGMPELMSNPITREGKQENRRLELSCNRPEILRPVILEDTLRQFNSDIMLFSLPKLDYALGGDWNIQIFQDGKEAWDYKISGLPPDEMEVPLAKLNPLGGPITYSIIFTDFNHDTSFTKQGDIEIEFLTIEEKQKRRSGIESIDRYSLILFDFDSSKLTFENKYIMDFINARIAPDAQVTVWAYTDRTGETEYNRLLSLDRADAASSMIRADNKKLFGMGESQLLFDNYYPEGRYYCRTVIIEVKTILK